MEKETVILTSNWLYKNNTAKKKKKGKEIILKKGALALLTNYREERLFFENSKRAFSPRVSMTFVVDVQYLLPTVLPTHIQICTYSNNVIQPHCMYGYIDLW